MSRLPHDLRGPANAPQCGEYLFRLECPPLCYNAFMRAGKTRTTSFSLDDVTLANLKALSLRRHRGNVSAFLAEVANRESKFAAAEAFFEKYGVPPLDEKDIAAIEAEWQGKRHRRRSRP